MNRKASPLAGLLVLTAVLVVMALGASVARADTGDIIEPQSEPPTAADGFQAGTCTSDEPVKCSPETPELFFEQAAGNPPIGFTQYIIRHSEVLSVFGLLKPIEEPLPNRTIKTLRVDLPAGLTVNPQATPEQCTLEEFENTVGEFHVPLCKPGTIVGREEVTLVVNAEEAVPAPSPPFPEGTFLPKGFVIPPSAEMGTKVPVYNLVPKFGEPALFGFVVAGKEMIFLEAEVAWDDDYHQSFRINLPAPSPPFSTLVSRLVNLGTSGDGSYITTPTTCFDPEEAGFEQTYSTFFRAESWGEPNPTFPVGSTPFEAALPPGVKPIGCAEVPFEPSLEVDPGTSRVDSPAPAEITVSLPFEPASELEQSHLRNASITLPAGMGLNPAAVATGLRSCSDAQFGKGTRNDIACPASSVIGTAEVETPPLPPGSLQGEAYLGRQLGFDPESGNMYRIFVAAESERYDVSARLVGHIVADRATGQLTARFLENPQVPFESVKLNLDPDRRALTSPPTCGPNMTSSSLEPWSTPASTATPSSAFALSTLPGGRPCPQTLADRPLNPGHEAGPREAQAGAFTPFDLKVTRPDGQQELKRIDVNLPPGMVARLKGVEYCPEAALAQAGSRAGTAETAEPSCPDTTFLGTATIHAGSGDDPLEVPGNVYLAGPYKGAPVSLAFVTPALTDPFDLGTVVVRVALHIDPETAEVTAVSDSIPHVFGGAKLDVRSIDVAIYRPRFTVNPTTCRRPFFIRTDIYGGGGNPLDPGAWESIEKGSEFRATNCRALRFKPRFFARILGARKRTVRTANPPFRVIYDARRGDANLARAAFIMPRATILDQSHIRTVCTRVQLAADNCPQASIYGFAKARSPMLNGILQGPVYLVSSDNELPDLLADLRGQVNIQLRGVISAVRGRLKTVFPRTPDVAVDKFLLVMRGGDRGLLINSQDLCRGPKLGFLNLTAQNSRRLKTNRLRLNVPACRPAARG